jgi:hypothetical protein
VNTEFENEQEKPQHSLRDLIASVRRRLRGDGSIEPRFHLDGVEIELADLVRDEQRFRLQEARLLGSPGLLVELVDDDGLSGQQQIDVPVDLDLASGISGRVRIARIAQRLADGGLSPRLADAAEMSDAFYDRVSETIAMRAHHISTARWMGSADTISSTTSGDDILCAKGWFLSTGSVVGQSACTITKKPGRYSLGVCAGAVTRYHPHVFNLPCSTAIHLNLP